MDVEARKKIVARLLSASKQATAEEAEILKNEPAPTLEFVYEHIRKYVLYKYLLSQECEEDSIRELARLSLARTMKIDKDVIRNLDQATPCDHATSESTKKVLLLYAVQKDLELKPNPEKIAKIETVSALADYVYAAITSQIV